MITIFVWRGAEISLKIFRVIALLSLVKMWQRPTILCPSSCQVQVKTGTNNFQFNEESFKKWWAVGLSYYVIFQLVKRRQRGKVVREESQITIWLSTLNSQKAERKSPERWWINKKKKPIRVMNMKWFGCIYKYWYWPSHSVSSPSQTGGFKFGNCIKSLKDNSLPWDSS